MPKNNSISKRQTTQNEIENSQNDLQSLQEALQPLGWNQARIKFLAAFLVAILTVQSVKTGAKILKSPDEFSPHQRGKLDRFSLTQSLLTTL